MIKINVEAGTLKCVGGIDILLTEYTILTRLIVEQLTDMKDKEKALETLSKLGLIAINDTDTSDANKIYDQIDEVLTNDLQI